MSLRECYIEHPGGNERPLEGQELIDALRDKIRPSYSLEQIEEIEQFLTDYGAFEIIPDTDGSLPAASGNKVMNDYKARWLRDQTLVAEAELECGNAELAVGVVRAAMRQSLTQRHRFGAIIREPHLKYNQNDRPHIRWAANERELPELWGHAQNDALGHYQRVLDTTIQRGLIEPTEEDLTHLGYHARYMEAIEYWQDPDHGCWEEWPKINMSSVSIAKQGLGSIIRIMRGTNLDTIDIPEPNGRMSIDRIQELVGRGEDALAQTLPHECVQPGQWREADAALLVPVWTGAIKGEQAWDVVTQVLRELKGNIGIKRYHNDQYWGSKGDAQWALFDSMVSSIAGRQQRIDEQIEFFNRSLMQFTVNPADPTKLAMPEMYHIESHNSDGTPVWTVNPNTPLLWAASNEKMAFHDMKRTLRAADL